MRSVLVNIGSFMTLREAQLLLQYLFLCTVVFKKVGDDLNSRFLPKPQVESVSKRPPYTPYT